MILAASSGINWTLVVPVVSAITALFAAIFGFIRNRRSDTITLYSSFVDDLHEEVTRLRTQYEEDRKSWSNEKAGFSTRVRGLEDENTQLRTENATLRIERAEAGIDLPRPVVPKPGGRTRKRAQGSDG